MTYYNQFDSYLEVEEGRSPGTRSGYLADIKRFRRWLDSGEEDPPLTWEEVTPRHLRAYLAWLSTDRVVIGEDGRERKLSKVGPCYLRRVHASLSKWFDYLIKVEGIRTTNPLVEIRKPRLPKRNPPALTPSEISRLIDTAIEESRTSERVRNWTMIAFLFHTGLRVQELCNMKMSDVSYHEGNPRVLSVIGKGNKERKVALNEEAARALTYWTRRVRRDIVVDLPPTRDSDFVWLIPAGKSKGQPIKPPAVRAMLRKLGNMAGIHVHPHKLRHSYGTEAVRNGAKPHAIQRSMGHASLATTGMYLHADEAELEQVAAVLPKVLSG